MSPLPRSRSRCRRPSQAKGRPQSQTAQNLAEATLATRTCSWGRRSCTSNACPHTSSGGSRCASQNLGIASPLQRRVSHRPQPCLVRQATVGRASAARDRRPHHLVCGHHRMTSMRADDLAFARNSWRRFPGLLNSLPTPSAASSLATASEHQLQRFFRTRPGIMVAFAC